MGPHRVYTTTTVRNENTTVRTRNGRSTAVVGLHGAGVAPPERSGEMAHTQQHTRTTQNVHHRGWSRTLPLHNIR